MRPFEKRLAAVEAKHLPSGSGDLPIFVCPIGADRQAFAADCAQQAGGPDFIAVVSVSPTSDVKESVH